MAGDADRIAGFLTRAEELRGIAARMNSAEAKELLLNIADDYVRLARALEKKTPKS